MCPIRCVVDQWFPFLSLVLQVYLNLRDLHWLPYFFFHLKIRYVVPTKFPSFHSQIFCTQLDPFVRSHIFLIHAEYMTELIFNAHGNETSENVGERKGMHFSFTFVGRKCGFTPTHLWPLHRLCGNRAICSKGWPRLSESEPDTPQAAINYH